MNQQTMNLDAEGQAAAMRISKIINGQTKLCGFNRKTLLIILFDYIKMSLVSIFNSIIELVFKIPILILARKVYVNKKLAQYIYKNLNYLLFKIKSICFYIICVVLSLVSPQNYLKKILFMVLQDTMDIFKKF